MESILTNQNFLLLGANEFILGDLRDTEFVRRVIQFKGEQGNFYNDIPYRLIRPFDEIYQFLLIWEEQV